MYVLQNQKIFSEIKTIEELKNSYIPFLKNKGIFVPLSHECKIGESIQLNLKLPDEKENVTLNTKIVILPSQIVQDIFIKGVGLEFDQPHAINLARRIENLLDLCD